MIIFQSFFNVEGQFSLENYKEFFTSQNLTYLKMSFNSVLYAGIVTLVTLLISTDCLLLTLLKHRQLWLMLIVLPTWVNLLLKAYAFIGIFGQNGSINSFLSFLGSPQADPLYRFLLYLCSQLHRVAIYDFTDL